MEHFVVLDPNGAIIYDGDDRLAAFTAALDAGTGATINITHPPPLPKVVTITINVS